MSIKRWYKQFIAFVIIVTMLVPQTVAAAPAYQKPQGSVVFAWWAVVTVTCKCTPCNGAATHIFLRGIGLIRSERHGWYLHNARTDVIRRVDANGEILHTYRYNAFGAELAPCKDNTNPFRFCAEYYDFETGRTYLRHRSYDPTTGRFTHEDPWWGVHNGIYGDNPVERNGRLVPNVLAIMQSGNLYIYCVNNPIMWTDSSGLFIDHEEEPEHCGGRLSNAEWMDSLGRIVVLGVTIDLGRGYFARIERGVGANSHQRHVHIYNSSQHWSQNEDGSPHDDGKNSPGNPPRRALDALKEKKGWDWRKKQDDWASKITTSMWCESGTLMIWFPSGRGVALAPDSFGRMAQMPNRNGLIRLYLERQRSEANNDTNNEADNDANNPPLFVPIPNPVPLPNPIPIPKPMPFPIPLF